MELSDYLLQIQNEVRSEYEERMQTPGDRYPFPESVFAERVMSHMADAQMTNEPQVCHFEATIGNGRLKLSGWGVSEDFDQLDLFVSLYEGVDTLTPVPDSETKTAVDQCLRFLRRCVEGRLEKTIDESNEAYGLVLIIREQFAAFDQIRIFVLTDRVAKSKNFQSREVQGKSITLEVMDIERLYRHCEAGKPRDEIVVNFEDVSGQGLPCVFVPGENAQYDYALTAMPGEALRFLYDKFGARLLEANVRSFLSATGKVNKGIRDTLRTDPERFMAYNNGIVVVADELRLGRGADGGTTLLWLKGMQIVNGGQTTASIYFTKRKEPGVDISRVRVPAKVIILKSIDESEAQDLVEDISRFANSQNNIRVSDLSANQPFHVAIEQLSATTYCPDGKGRWFYERAAGSYNVLLAREGSTPAKLKKLKEDVPTARRVTKTDLAKYLNAWAQQPHIVSRGAQKNFTEFMVQHNAEWEGREFVAPTLDEYRAMIAKTIIYRTVQKRLRPQFAAFQANVTTYTVAILARQLGRRLDLQRVWTRQAVSAELLAVIDEWAAEVNDVLHRSSGGRMISEWAKRPECWEAVRQHPWSTPTARIPECR